MKPKAEVKLCRKQQRVYAIFGYTIHVCTRPKGHKGKHRCEYIGNENVGPFGGEWR